MSKKLKHTNIPCRYKLMKLVPKSINDLNRKLDWEAYGAIVLKEIVLTEDDYKLILNALYEQAVLHEQLVGIGRKLRKYKNNYSDSIREVAKKFEKIFWVNNDKTK